jgi:hypothetical protein
MIWNYSPQNKSNSLEVLFCWKHLNKCHHG